MRTVLSCEQLLELVARHFDGVNYVVWDVDSDHSFQGVIVDHPYTAEPIKLREELES